MKKNILLSLLFFLQISVLKAQWVTIPDANFVNWLTTNYSSCMNGNQMDTTCPPIESDTILTIQYTLISDLTGVENFINLKHLYCGNNQLNNLPELPPNLKTLYCDDNQLSSLPPLPNSLSVLSCWQNQITNLPNLPNSLIQLEVAENQLTSLPALPSTLTSINCRSNTLSNLPSLPQGLSSLICDSNQLMSLPNLPSNYFTTLICNNNLLTSLPNLPQDLYTLVCSNNLLSTLPPLTYNLNTLICNNNQLTYLPNIPNMLANLDCSNNQLTSLSAVPNSMNTFAINNNSITCLNNLPFLFFSSNGNISNNLLTCLPNQTNYSLGLPVCIENDTVNNPNQCPTAAIISGFVYQDMNNNCLYNNNVDVKTQHIAVKLYDNQNNLIANSYTIDGAYSFALVQPDSFIVKLDDTNSTFSMGCGQANFQNVVVDSLNQSIFNINFPVVCDTAYDIKVNSVNSQGWVFPGQQHTLTTNITNNINWYNLNCSSINYSGTVAINITGPISFVAPANNALTPIVIGNTFTYNITDFNTLTSQSFGLQFLTDTTAQANDQICVHVEINPTPLDADTTNNVYDFCYQVVNSYDPNMKEVYPVNVLPGYDDWFTYTIHFQNTGNAPAFNIRLRDTLDANLDINSFEVRGYSHPAQISINGNILTVRFNNIMLPDSTTDYEGSMGYFQYRLKPLPNLPNGTQIENTAYIYFDYNAPIVTNTTQNNFDITVKTNTVILDEAQFVLYPNPSAGLFLFKDIKNIKTVEVFNIMGELVLSQGNAKIINLQAYPKGIYVARINGTQVCRLVKE
jgi:uncharacterized repeat protein (TIGR01451 family)